MTYPGYLVTGGAGFIGSNFIRNMLHHYPDIHIINLDKLTYAGNLNNLSDIEQDPRYTFVRGDICRKKDLADIFDRYRPAYVVNFAAESHVDRSILRPSVFIESNISGVQNLLEAAVKSGVKKFVQISTDEVYGSLGPEGFFTEHTLLAPRSPYSASKAGADLLTLAYFHTFGMPVNITRCSNNYGPYQFPEKLIPLTILHCLNRKQIPVYGDGLNIRDWIHVDDHCSAIDLVLHRSSPGEVFNIGAENERSNISLVHQILQIVADLRPDLKITENLISFVEDRKGHDRRYAIDSSKIRNDLHWKAKIAFADGLTDTVRWYIDHEQWLNSVVTKDYLTYYNTRYKKTPRSR